MAQCSGACTKQVFESRNSKIKKFKQDPITCSAPSDDDSEKAFADAIKQNTQDVDGCATDCQCIPFDGQDPTWTPWTETPVTATYMTGPCKYTIQGTVEIRSRIFDGLCQPETITGTEMIFSSITNPGDLFNK
ncbi:MAG: hypothetical protein GY765_17520 [bacterium]|nr:hypothetical protein [bacterium]